VSVVRAGEKSSKLPETFDDLRKYLEVGRACGGGHPPAHSLPRHRGGRRLRLRAVPLHLYRPQVRRAAGQLSVKKPLLTQLVLGAADFARHTWWLTIPLFLLWRSACPLPALLRPVALGLDYVKLHLPVFGPLNLMLALSRFTHNLALLYRSGIPILEALRLSGMA